MTVTVVTPAESHKLTTFDRMAFELGGIDVSEQDMIEIWIDVASQQIVDYCGRSFAKEEIIEKVATKGDSFLWLGRYPLEAITSIVYDGDTINPITDYVIDNPDRGVLYRAGSWAPSEDRKWSIQYTAGYVLPSFNTGTRDLPASIEQACVILAKGFYYAVGEDPNVTQQRIGDYSVTRRGFMGTGGPFHEAAAALLGPYRDLRF